jgi:hypothetical protein
MKVRVQQQTLASETVVAVQSAQTGAILWAWCGRGARGAAAAMIDALAWCARNGHEVSGPAIAASAA